MSRSEANILFSGRFLLLNTAKDLATGSVPVLKQIQNFSRLGQVWVNGGFAKINCLKKYKKSPVFSDKPVIFWHAVRDSNP